MFTGLIQRIGTVRRVSRGRGLVLEIEADEPWERPIEVGESITVDGVCLTAAACAQSRFTADVLRETEAQTGLGEIVPGAKVNLERALRAGDAMGGHIVQGHVECRGRIAAKIPRGRDFRLRIACGRVFASACVERGSVAIDGVSLTISALGDDWFAVDVIPSTARATTLGAAREGAHVNLEGDVIGRYALKAARRGVTEQTLVDAGFL